MSISINEIKKDSVELKETEDYVISIYQDIDYNQIFDPMENYNLSNIYCFHRNYKIGNEHNFSDYEDMFFKIAEELNIQNDENDDFHRIQLKIQQKEILKPLYI